MAEYSELMTQWQSAQANCMKVIALQKKKLEAFKDTLKRYIIFSSNSLCLLVTGGF